MRIFWILFTGVFALTLGTYVQYGHKAIHNYLWRVRYKILQFIIAMLSLLFGIYLLFLFFNPVFMTPEAFFSPRKITSIEYANKYYGILGSIATVFIAGLGLFLGAIYYVNRNRFDESQRLRDQRRQRLEIFMDKLSTYDESVASIIGRRVKNDKELAFVRARIERLADDFTLLLEEGTELLGLNKPDVTHVLKLYAYVDKSEVITTASHARISDIPQEEIVELQSKYNDLRDTTFKVCYKRTV